MEKSRELLEEISKWEMKLSESGVKFFKEPISDSEGIYHILYVTVQKSTGRFYVGIHSSEKLKDNYLGCGITSNVRTISVYVKRNLRRSALWREVLRVGAKDFKRSDILYFTDRATLISAEKSIVTKEFVNRSLSFNVAIGGGVPPTNKGTKNGNYGNKWTDEQKSKASEYFKENRSAARGNNGRAVKCLTVDIFTKEVKEYQCGRDLADAIDVTHLTIATWLSNKDKLNGNIRRGRFVCFLKTDYDDKIQSGTLLDHIRCVISNSCLINKPEW